MEDQWTLTVHYKSGFSNTMLVSLEDIKDYVDLYDQETVKHYTLEIVR